MDWNFSGLLSLYIIGLVVPAGVGIYAFIHRHVSGAYQFGWYIAARSIWNLCLLLELLSDTSRGKVFWLYGETLSIPFVILFMAAFIFTYADLKPRKLGLAWAALILPSVSYFLLLATNDRHGLIFQTPHFDPSIPNSLLHIEYTTTDWLTLIYCVLIILVFLGILIGKSSHAQPLYRSQMLTIMLGILMDTIGIGLAITLNRRGIIPPASAMGNLIIAWGLFRYRLFDLRPIARDMLFENMADLVVVLDAQDRIVDINPSALKEFKMTESRVIGQPVNSVFFSEWEEYRKPFVGSKEFFIKRKGKYFHFDIHSTLLHDKHGTYQGRIFVARDITSYANLQWQLKELNEELKTLNADLENRVKQRTMELAEAYDTTLQGWARALELRDKETEGHSRRVTDLTLKLASALDVADSDLDDIRRGALLHDIGKMAIPDEILRKANDLTRKEREIVSMHPLIAYQLLSPIKFLEKALEIPYCHHERWDGGGYPRGLKGEEIPLSARIFSIVDVWDAIQSDRVYRKAWPRSRARAYMKKQSARYFDPSIVKVFLDLISAERI
ncbi:MAG: HD domain-containing phosphohydrolase [Chloroflexota bacterium]